jgi:3-oxoadipate enol-lactonase
MRVEANGCVFECRIDADADSWVTLSHGLATDMSMWDELAEALRNRFRVLRYDARGHGQSRSTPGDYTLSLLVADVVGILDALNIDQTHFVGLSMGGMVAQGLMLDHPHRVRSAVIADSRPENTRQMHRMIPNSEFLEIPQAGHIANIEQPAIFNRAVLSFLHKVKMER